MGLPHRYIFNLPTDHNPVRPLRPAGWAFLYVVTISKCRICVNNILCTVYSMCAMCKSDCLHTVIVYFSGHITFF